MAQVTREANEMFEDKFYEDWQEWKDGDDSALYDSGYQDGLIKAIQIIDSVRDTPDVDLVPFHLTMSAVASTLRELAKG
jgi:hypothetical protein